MAISFILFALRGENNIGVFLIVSIVAVVLSFFIGLYPETKDMSDNIENIQTSLENLSIRVDNIEKRVNEEKD